MDDTQDLQNIQIELAMLAETVFRKYGYDFRDYSEAHLRRRIKHAMQKLNAPSISALQHEILYDKACFDLLLRELSINVTEMFRDPSFYRLLREEIIPALKTYPFVKIWHAGCASGEEVYSMAILLKEEGLYDKAQIYATDFNARVLQRAKEAIFPIELIKEYTANYIAAGGRQDFSDYYTAAYDSIILSKSLRERIVFSDHNLATDTVFGEMHMVICRNVMIYFNQELQDRVVKLFADSLCYRGVLCLGSKESLRFNANAALFEAISATEKVYKKTGRQ